MPAADLAGSKDPPGMKRYEGSEIIGYREPRPPGHFGYGRYEGSRRVCGGRSRLCVLNRPGDLGWDDLGDGETADGPGTEGERVDGWVQAS